MSIKSCVQGPFCRIDQGVKGVEGGLRLRGLAAVSRGVVFPSQPGNRQAALRSVQTGLASISASAQPDSEYDEGFEMLFRETLCAENRMPAERAGLLLQRVCLHLQQLDRKFAALCGKVDTRWPLQKGYLHAECEVLDWLDTELAALKGEARLMEQDGCVPGIRGRRARAEERRIGRVQRACRNLVAQRWKRIAGSCPEGILPRCAGDSPQACVQAFMQTLRDADWRKVRGVRRLQLALAVEKARLSWLLDSERRMSTDAILARLKSGLERYERAYRLTGNESGGVRPDVALQSAFARGCQSLQSHCEAVLSCVRPDESCFSRQATLTTLDYWLQSRQVASGGTDEAGRAT